MHVLVVDADEPVGQQGGWGGAADDEAVVIGREGRKGQVGDDVGLEVCEEGFDGGVLRAGRDEP